MERMGTLLRWREMGSGGGIVTKVKGFGATFLPAFGPGPDGSANADLGGGGTTRTLGRSRKTLRKYKDASDCFAMTGGRIWRGVPKNGPKAGIEGVLHHQTDQSKSRCLVVFANKLLTHRGKKKMLFGRNHLPPTGRGRGTKILPNPRLDCRGRAKQRQWKTTGRSIFVFCSSKGHG